ncbi:ATP-binding protein [Nocardioides sp. HDW12B]|uniref:ATP-binding protein n=1 Tax=Nocardioides sp. HDW12B TaxID=2714939 RepID=UPI00140E90BC|nr:ATP-binding protein [Nocardioides sp. HDW12B]QIK66470.1 ATP-binding protein [Nocardioides sp. HDW12B]
MTRSPFRPSFGTNPPTVAGRDAVVAEFADALDSGPGARGRAALFTGNRGIGKTVMLNESEAVARERGWVVVSETATPGLLDRITRESLPELADLLRQGPREQRRVSGVHLPANLGGVDFELPAAESPGGLRTQLNALTDELERNGTGLLLTLDEVHSRRARDDVAQLCAVVQHAFREERPVAFAAAGLPAAVQDLLSEDVSTFLRRARRYVLEPLTPVAAEEALRVPVVDNGRRIGSAALTRAAAATYGYPFLVQLVGDQAWRQDASSEEITEDHVAVAVEASLREVGALVHEPALNDLSETDRAFVKVMVEDEGESAIADVERRLGRDHGYVSRYRSRLIVAGIIEPTRRGYVDFTIPYMREFVRANRDRL